MSSDNNSSDSTSNDLDDFFAALETNNAVDKALNDITDLSNMNKEDTKLFTEDNDYFPIDNFEDSLNKENICKKP
jgi:hypothetical protein